ncbi:MAG: right-handed parallel beta-helix repeat-containing protein [Chthoniobacteraceae bacterium]
MLNMILPRFIRSFFYIALIFASVIGTVLPCSAEEPGPFPAEMVAWSDATKQAQREAGEKLLASLREAAKRGEREVRVPTGNYRFKNNTGGRYPAHIVFGRDFDGMTLDFQGSSLWFETEASGIALAGTRKLTLRNVFLDWDPLPFMQGTVVKLSPETGTLDIKLDPGYDRTVPALAVETWRGRGIAFDRHSRELKAGQSGCEVTFSWKEREPDGSYRIRYHGYDAPLDQSGISVGDPFVMLMRMQRAVRVEGGTDTLLEDVTLYSSPFVGFVHAGGSGGVFRRCNILRRPGTNRLMAGNADGINCDNMEKGPVIEGCRIETIGDDFVNVHGHLARVLTQESPTVVIVSRMNRRAEINEPVTVEFLQRNTMKSLGKRQATAQVVPAWKIDRENTLADLGHQWHSGDAASLAYGKTTSVHRVTLDQPIQIDGDVIMVCEQFSSTGAIIRDNCFKGSLARGLRLQSPHVLVENNTIAITEGAGLTLYGHAAFWGEGPYVYDAIVRNNTFIDTAIGVSRGAQRASLIVEEGDYRSVRLNHDIKIDGNTFIRSGGPAIVVRGIDDSSIVGNHIDGYDVFPKNPPSKGKVEPEGLDAAIVVEAVKNVKIQGNEVKNPGPYATGLPVVKID